MSLVVTYECSRDLMRWLAMNDASSSQEADSYELNESSAKWLRIHEKNDYNEWTTCRFSESHPLAYTKLSQRP